jgi:hypothetical protein
VNIRNFNRGHFRPPDSNLRDNTGTAKRKDSRLRIVQVAAGAVALSLRILLSGGDSEEKDVIVFYDAEGKVVRVLPAKDVVFIVPERLLRPEQPSRPDQPPKKMVWPGEETKDEE